MVKRTKSIIAILLAMRPLCVFLVLLSVSDKTALALDPQKPISRYGRDVWQTEHGLPQNTVHDIIQTRDGYIWLATEEGLVRFDGTRFKVFNKQNTEQLKSNQIQFLFEDREGGLWIGTAAGLTRFKDRRFSVYTTRDGLSNDNVRSIHQDREGNIWVGTPDGLSRFKDGSFTAYTTKEGLPNSTVTAIHEGRSGDLWVGTLGGLSQFKNERFTGYTTKDGLPNDSVRTIYEDRNGNLWVGTLGGLSQFKYGAFTTYTTKQGLSNDRIWSIYEDHKGNLWIGTDGGLNHFNEGKFAVYTTKDGLSDNTVWSIYEYSKATLWLGTPGGLNRFKDGQFTSYTIKEGLSDNIVLSVYEDREGSLWIGTEAGGLNRLKDTKFTTYTTKDGLSNDLVWSICEGRDGSLWIGTHGGGLNRLKYGTRCPDGPCDGRFTAYTTKDGLANNIVRALYEDREGNLWVGTPSGLTRWKNNRFTTYTVEDGLSNNAVWALTEDRDGTLWIGTLGGLTEYKDGRFRVYTIEDDLSDDAVMALHADRKGNLWIGTRGGRLNRFKDGEFTAYTINGAVSDDSIRAIYEDKEGGLWIGTRRSGLSRFKDGEFTTYTTKEGLFDDCVFQILEDSKANLWMSSARGVFRASKKELDDFAEGRIAAINSVSYGTADGMLSRECNGGQPAGWKTRDGRLWFPTVKGVAMIAPEALIFNEQVPPVVIEQAIIDNQFVEPGEKIELAPGKERYEFHYTGLSLIAPEKLRFRYKLEGFDEGWVDAGTERVAYYTNIPPGDYKFKVLACNNDGVWNEVGASLDFYLKPHFYQTYWFYALCVVALALIGAGLYRLRVKRMRAQFSAVLAERTRIAREIHDTLAQGFVGIALQLEAVEKTLSEAPQKARQHLSLAHNMVSHSLAEARRSVWDLRSQALESTDLATALGDMAKQMTAGTQVRANVRVLGNSRRLSAVVENNILRIGQEALTNAIKHAASEEILIELSFDADRVQLRVQDNGRGFDATKSFSATDGHFGLIGMRERVEHLGGQLSLKSRPGEGTEILAVIPTN